jgi:hypothetical protein
MTTLYTIHEHNDEKLQSVIEEMRTLGSATVRVVDCGDFLMALEGCHRIAAAKETGIPLDLIILEQDDVVNSNTLDWQDLQPEMEYVAGELAGEAFSPSCGIFNVDSDGVVS